MTRKEVELLTNCLRSAKNYLEFGSGESTSMAVSRQNIGRIDSVENDQRFFSEVLENRPEIKEAIKNQRLHFHFPDLGKTREWGTPVNTEKKHLWPLYSSAVFSEGIPYDLVLVDGRFRVACALQALQNCPEGVRILVHDFTIRPQYRVLLDFLEVEESADSLVLLKEKKGLNQKQLKQTLAIYSFLPEDKTLWFRIFNRLPRLIWEKLGFSKPAHL